jgi:hypothetical protein
MRRRLLMHGATNVQSTVVTVVGAPTWVRRHRGAAAARRGRDGPRRRGSWRGTPGPIQNWRYLKRPASPCRDFHSKGVVRPRFHAAGRDAEFMRSFDDRAN